MNEAGTGIRRMFAKPAYPRAYFSDHGDCHLVRFAGSHAPFSGFPDAKHHSAGGMPAVSRSVREVFGKN